MKPEQSSGGRIRTCDLRVMSPTSYLTAPPRGVTYECSQNERDNKRWDNCAVRQDPAGLRTPSTDEVVENHANG